MIITYVLKEPKWFSVESMLIYRDYVLVFKCLRELAAPLTILLRSSKMTTHGKKIRWTFQGKEQPQIKEPSITEQFHCGIPYRGGHWDFRFCGFGCFFDRFFGFCVKRLRFFGFGVQCGLRIFRVLASGFRFS